MSLEEEEEIARMRTRMEAMEEILIDLDLLMHNLYPYTWNVEPEGVRIKEQIKALGLPGQAAKEE